MKIFPLEIPDVKIFIPDVHHDDRGYFFEAFREEILAAEGIQADFVQDNLSCSVRGVLRGMHLQDPPHAQGKLVRVIRGAVLDVAVDLRKNSPTYGKWVSQILSSENNLLMWVPPGFAHGFLALGEENYFYYKCTSYFQPDSERIIVWNDPDLDIHWGLDNPQVSGRDGQGCRFRDFNSLF